MDLAAKVGPLPAWAWGGLIGVGVLMYSYSRSATTRAANATPVTIDPIDAAFAPGTANGTSLATTASTGPLDTNQAWLVRGVQTATGMGSSAVDSTTALQTYLDGGQLTYNQGQLLDKVLIAIGLPPNGADTPRVTAKETPPVTGGLTGFVRFVRDDRGVVWGVYADGTTRGINMMEYLALGNPALAADNYRPPAPPPAPAPPAPAPAQQTYTVVRGDNLSQIAARFGTSWQAIYDANRDVIGGNPNLIYAGQTYVIP